jgi:hypothetical protein
MLGRKHFVALFASMVALATVETGCPDGHPTHPVGSTVQCPDGPHVVQDCEMAFNLDSQKISGSMSVFQLGAKIDSEKQAMRQVNEQLMSYSVKQRELCKGWNGCSVTQDDYRRAQAQNNKVLDGVKAAAEDYQQADKAGDERAKTNSMTKTVVMTAPETLLQIEFSAVLSVPKDPASVPRTDACKEGVDIKQTAPRVVGADATVPTGSEARFRVKVNKPAYVYLFQKFDETKELRVLFPDKQIALKNPLEPDKEHVLPDTENTFCLDEKNIGLERVFIVASTQELTDMTSAVAAVEKGQYTTIPALKELDTIASADAPTSGCKKRAFVLKKAGGGEAEGTCPLSRGWVLKSKSTDPSSPVSFTATADAGDTMIVKVFPVQHVRSWEWNGSTNAAPPPARRGRDIMILQ